MMQYYKGEVPNIFSPHFSGGTLYDLGVYLVYCAVELFGLPKETQYFANIIKTGVDGMGVIIFRYENFDVTMHMGKTATSFVMSEIYEADETLIIDSIADITSIEIHSRKDTPIKKRV